MEKGDETEHGGHTAPFIAGEQFAQRSALDRLYNDVHGLLPSVDANHLQEVSVKHAQPLVHLKFACQPLAGGFARIESGS